MPQTRSGVYRNLAIPVAGAGQNLNIDIIPKPQEGRSRDEFQFERFRISPQFFPQFFRLYVLSKALKHRLCRFGKTRRELVGHRVLAQPLWRDQKIVRPTRSTKCLKCQKISHAADISGHCSISRHDVPARERGQSDRLAPQATLPIYTQKSVKRLSKPFLLTLRSARRIRASCQRTILKSQRSL